MSDGKQSRGPQRKVVPLSEVPYATLKRLGDRLDMAYDGTSTWWRKLIEKKADPRYDMITVAKLARAGQQQDGSPGYELLMDMSNRGVTYGELVSLLKKVEYFDALKEIGYKEDVSITKHPHSTPVMLGQRLLLECSAEGVPSPSYQWFRGKQPLSDQRSSTLVIEQVRPQDEGIYACRAMNDANCVFSNWATVQIQNPVKKGAVIYTNLAEETPAVLEQPQSQSLEVGQALLLSCHAVGSGVLEYRWFKDGQSLPFGHKRELCIDPVQLADQGAYTCQISSSVGTSTLSAVAEVSVAPPRMSAFSSPGHSQQGTGYGEMFTQHMQPPGAGGMMVSEVLFDGSHTTHMMDYNATGGLGLTPSEGGYGPPHQLMHPGTLPFRLPPTYHPGGGPMVPTHIAPPQHPPPPPHMPPLSSQLATSPRIPSPAMPVPHLDPEARGQDQPTCFIDKQCSDKVALLVGNKNYHVSNLQLNTPENDCQDLAGILRSADFKVVSLVNLTKREMDDAINYFMELIGPNVYALFFFAGHGFELQQMNYMMAVDCSKEKNPRFCVCAQDVLRRMQEGGAKLSIVLLDMCRVSAPHYSILNFGDGSGIYQPPFPAQTYAGYHVFGFSCSPAEKAFEVAGEGDAAQEIGLISKDNSIFVAALKAHLQAEKNTLQETVKGLLDGTAEGVFRFRPTGPAGVQWQRPEIRHNLAEDLSLADPTDRNLLPEQQLQRSVRWRDAHMVPDPVVVGSNNGQLALRIHYEAEHSNVLVVKVELLQGCLTETTVERMKVELVIQEKPIRRVLSSEQDIERQFSSIDLQKSFSTSKLLYFKIPDLQKIIAHEVQLQIEATYRWRQRATDECSYQTHTDLITHCANPPPLYGRVTAHYAQEVRMSMIPPVLQAMASP